MEGRASGLFKCKFLITVSRLTQFFFCLDSAGLSRVTVRAALQPAGSPDLTGRVGNTSGVIQPYCKLRCGESQTGAGLCPLLSYLYVTTGISYLPKVPSESPAHSTPTKALEDGAEPPSARCAAIPFLAPGSRRSNLSGGSLA